MTQAAIKILSDREALGREAAARFAAEVTAAVAARGTAAVALAGGQTPRRLYEVLAARPARDRVPWSEIEIFFSDERAVPSDDGRSNYRMVRESLLVHVPVRRDRVHRMPADDPDLKSAALSYARVLASRTNPEPGAWPRLDIVLLGLGSDGHTASLFPGDPALDEREQSVAAVETLHEGTGRITLTLPVLNAAARVLFLVAGAGKAEAVRRVLVEHDETLPAARVRPASGELIWLLDAAAAGKRM